MKIITGTTQFELEESTAIAIGKFDGIHIGHKKLISEILKAKEQNLKSCVFTFDPPPAVLFGLSDGRELTTREEKRCLFERMGVDILIEFPMTLETAAILPLDFIENILVKRMKAALIVAGEDVSFGAKGKGNSSLLKEMSVQFHYDLKIIKKVCHNGREISSTYVRSAVETGNMKLVRSLLGMAYPFAGKVVQGNQLGRTLGFPTANLEIVKEKLLPPCGVYYSEVFIEGKKYKGISNVGYKPTVNKDKIPGIETYVYDLDENLYGKDIEVGLLEFKRPELSFLNVAALKKQVDLDLEDGKKFLFVP